MTENEFETGPAEGLIPIAMRNPNELAMTNGELAILSAFAKSPAYRVWQKLSEAILEKTETGHFRNWKDKEAFERTGLVAVAQRTFYEELQLEMKRQLDDFATDYDVVKRKKEALSLSLEEQIVQEFK